MLNCTLLPNKLSAAQNHGTAGFELWQGLGNFGHGVVLVKTFRRLVCPSYLRCHYFFSTPDFACDQYDYATWYAAAAAVYV